jgi:hypothetical protein
MVASGVLVLGTPFFIGFMFRTTAVSGLLAGISLNL